ncbi:hypothetical protein BDZ94DRAFT_1260512 [Collybia nuda]|uniref:F-box domain-containing protein n=1 Tax=Collybia nuda TaxID=64659 RepID=A0A9P5Y5P0_9AGAR|nr:hypothetical protein BDZ94DRAFT_1260512 [Collybia nuda]
MESPFIHVFDTNYVPTDDELKQIRQLIIQPSMQRDILDAEISRLQAQREQLNDFVTHHQALLSPIRRIPPDILQEIFVRCLPAKHNSIMSHREAPLLFGRVCSYWRNLSRATPELWASIHISVPELGHGENPEDDTVFVWAVSDWLGRSGALPLSLSVYESPLWRPVETGSNIMTCLRSVSSRWKHIDLSIYPFVSPISFALSAEQVPLLESFSIELHKDSSLYVNHPASPSNHGIFQAPRLRGLSICSSLLSTDTSVAWSHLTELIIAGKKRQLRIDIALAALERCKTLESCTLEFELPDRSLQIGSNTRNTRVTVPLLKTLAVRGGSNLGPFFDSLDFPMLLRFSFYLDFKGTAGSPFDCPQLYTFLGRSSTLDTLSLSALSFPRESLISCITGTPNISKLYLHGLGDQIWVEAIAQGISGIYYYLLDDQILSLLTPTSMKNALCPALKLIECDASLISDDVLLNFIQSRTILSSTYNIPRLKHVVFKLHGRKGDEAFSVPPEVLSGGSEVKVSYFIPDPPSPRTRYPRRGIFPEKDSRPRLTTPFGRCIS